MSSTFFRIIFEVFDNLSSDLINAELEILSVPNLIGVRGFLISCTIFLATSDQALIFALE